MGQNNTNFYLLIFFLLLSRNYSLTHEYLVMSLKWSIFGLLFALLYANDVVYDPTKWNDECVKGKSAEEPGKIEVFRKVYQ